uniref:Uncharacterized protein n=1 Tax=Octopus bimaculoides TaxID=37653 RepID=A0A0L8HS82_OCTBM
MYLTLLDLFNTSASTPDGPVAFPAFISLMTFLQQSTSLAGSFVGFFLGNPFLSAVIL